MAVFNWAVLGLSCGACCSDKDVANLMDIMQRCDLGEDIAGSAADQLITLVRGGCVPGFLSHPSFLENLVARAGQHAHRLQPSGPAADQEQAALSRLPKAAVELLAEITQRNLAALSLLASDKMR